MCSRRKKIVCFAGDELIVTCNAIPGPWLVFSLTYISSFFFFFLRFISAPLAPTIDHPTTRSRAISDFNNRARARRKYCFCDNREQNIFQGTKDLFFFIRFSRERRTQDCHRLSIGCRRTTTVRRGKEGRYTQKTKDLPGHGILESFES